MQRRNAMMLVLVVAGCADSPVARRLPGVFLDDTSRAGLASANPTPQCGYDYYRDDRDDVPGAPPTLQHQVTTFLYDQDGLITADYDVDDSGARVYSETIRYNAMGQPVQRSVLKPDGGTAEYYNVYDSFGLVVRRSLDSNGDGVDDGFTVYRYGPDHQRLSAHTERSGGFVIDDVYSYDEMGRTSKVVNTSTEEELTFTIAYTYDDAAHTMNGIGTKSSGVYYTGVTTYNSDDLIESDASTYMDPSSGAVTSTSTTTNTYKGKDMISALWVWASPPSDSSPGRKITERAEYHYGDCQRDPSR
ncbi:MAG TPA: hypothetical protein VFT22_23205 [Kofleriaceae bacterium]|nr:hypothetical protein [Kofleriaceae bacterium]